MRDFVPAIYDTTVIIPKASPAPTMLRILKGQSSVVSVSISVDSIAEILLILIIETLIGVKYSYGSTIFIVGSCSHKTPCNE